MPLPSRVEYETNLLSLQGLCLAFTCIMHQDVPFSDGELGNFEFFPDPLHHRKPDNENCACDASPQQKSWLHI